MSEGAVSFASGLLAVTDGPELLVYTAAGAPLWKAFCDGVLADVRIAGELVFALDADGRVAKYRILDGRLQDTVAVEGTGAGLDGAGGAVLVRTGTDVHVLDGGAVRGLGQGATTAAAWGMTRPVVQDKQGKPKPQPERRSIGVGWPNGSFRAIDPGSGAAYGEIALGAAVTAIAYSARGVWLVAAGPQVFAVSGDAKQIVATFAMNGPVAALAASEDGVLLAVLVGTSQIALVELHANQPCGHVDFRRMVGGICWGPPGQLAIGLDDGDATRLDVFTGGSVRNEPHPGRGRTTWNYEDHLEKERIRGAMAYAKAGGSPIAKYVGAPDDGMPWWQIALIVLVVSIVLCTGCTGCSGLTWYLYSNGLLPF